MGRRARRGAAGRLRAALAIAGVGLSPAAAAPEAGALPTRYEGTLAIFSTSLPAVFFSGGGDLVVDATPAGHLSGLALPASGFATTAAYVNGSQELRITARNGAGRFLETPSGFRGAMPLLGNARLCLLGTCDAAPLLDLSFPLDVVGAGGTTTRVTPSGLTLRIRGAAWSTGSLTLSGPGFVSFFSGARSGPGGATSSTALAGGGLLLVTPVRLEAGSVGGLGTIDFVILLDLELVPEPAAAWLVAPGILCVLAARRMGRARSALDARLHTECAPRPAANRSTSRLGPRSQGSPGSGTGGGTGESGLKEPNDGNWSSASGKVAVSSTTLRK